MMSRIESLPFSSVDDTPERKPLCQKPPSPMIDIVRRAIIGPTPAALARLMP